MQGIDFFEPKRLELARQMYDGLTRTGLAAILGVAPSTVKKWEDGTHSPQGETLIKLSEALGIPEHWFLRKAPDFGDPVYLNRAKKRVLKSACERSNAMLKNLAEVCQISEEWVDLPTLDLPEPLSRNESLNLDNGKIQQISEDLRKRWGLGKAPISNLTKRIEKAGIVVTRFDIGYDNMDGTSTWINDRPYIFVAADKNNYFRSRFDLAHELAHIVLHKNLTEKDKVELFDKLEEQAHFMASCILFPLDIFSIEVSRITLESLTVLKKRWGISIAAMLYKAGQLELISSDTKDRLWRSYRYRGYTKGEPLDSSIDPEQPTLLLNTIKLLLEQGGFEKSNIIDKFGLAKHLELLSGLPKGFLNEDFGTLVTMKPKVQKTNEISINKKQAEIISFYK